MSEWRTVRLGDVVVFNPESVKKGYPHDIIEYLDIASVGSNVSSGTQSYRLAESPGRAKRLVRDGDTIISTVRPNLKTYMKISNPLDNLVVSTGFAVMRPMDNIDADFLFYSVTNQKVIDEMAAIADSKTTSYPAVSADDIANIRITMPEKVVQKKIGYVLSVYDKSIKNNNRRIATLEEMAQRLYREWFVHFRFPGHENVEMVDSELGMIPKGWEVHTPKELSVHYIGGGWGKESCSTNLQPAFVIRGTDIPDARRNNISNCPLRFHTESNLKERCLSIGDIVIEVSGGSKGQPVGRTLLITEELLNSFNGKRAICASFCKLYRCNTEKISPYYLYLWLLEIYRNGEIERYQSQSTGIINFKFEYFLDSPIALVPDFEVREAFDKQIEMIFRQINLLGRKNVVLRKTRDLLLPRLISGSIDVSAIDITISEGK